MRPETWQPKGPRFVDDAGTVWIIVEEPGHPNDGWLCRLHRNGEDWVTHRPARPEDYDLARLRFTPARSLVPGTDDSGGQP